MHKSILNQSTKVAVYVPAYNAESTIKASLNSILAQTYKNLEIIIINDGSTDKTGDILKEYQQTHNIKILTHKKNMGIEKTYNEIYNIVSCELVCIYHADDIYEPNIIEQSVNVLQKNSAVVGVFSLSSSNFKFAPEELKNNNNDYIILDSKKLFLLLLKYYNFIVTPSACLRTNSLNKAKIKWGKASLKPKLVQGHSGEDLQMWLDLAKYGPIAIIGKPLIYWRQHSNQMSKFVKRGLKTTSDFVHVIEYNIENGYLRNILDESYRNFNFIKYKEFNIAALNSILLEDKLMYSKNIHDAKCCVKNNLRYLVSDRWVRKKYLKYFVLNTLLKISISLKYNSILRYIKEKYFQEY